VRGERTEEIEIKREEEEKRGKKEKRMTRGSICNGQNGLFTIRSYIAGAGAPQFAKCVHQLHIFLKLVEWI
jgi:hypothetical protein